MESKSQPLELQNYLSTMSFKNLIKYHCRSLKNNTIIMTIQNRNDLNQAFRMRADSIVVSDSLIGGSLLIAERVQNRRFPTVVLKRITDGESCKVSMGEGVVIPVDREMATETLDMLEQLERMNIELDVEEVVTRKINLYYGS